MCFSITMYEPCNQAIRKVSKSLINIRDADFAEIGRKGSNVVPLSVGPAWCIVLAILNASSKSLHTLRITVRPSLLYMMVVSTSLVMICSHTKSGVEIPLNKNQLKAFLRSWWLQIDHCCYMGLSLNVQTAFILETNQASFQLWR